MTIPPDFFRESWEDATHEMACVDLDNKFVIVNQAFERMLGYSTTELKGRTWMEFTKQEDVGGDLASVKAVIDGVVPCYQLEKDYIHRRGYTVPVVLTVRRYPRATHLDMMLFRVEAPVATASRVELQGINRKVEEERHRVEERLRKLEERTTVSVETGDHWNDGNKSGGNMTSNSDASVKIIGGVLIVIASSLVWIAYYITTSQRESFPVSPPVIIKE
jgi:PAS domain S-box-containing protein